jgi:hypothetical protein
MLRCEPRRLLALRRGLDRLVMGLRPDGELARSRLRRGARTTGGTGTTRGPVKTDVDDRIARDIASRPSVDTGIPLGTVGVLGIPIQHKGLQVIASSGLMLTAIRSKGRTQHIDLIVALRGDE